MSGRSATRSNAAFDAYSTGCTSRIRFSRTNLDHAWEAHVQGSRHEVAESPDPVQLEAFRDAYTADLTRLLEGDKDMVRDGEVIYAFGCKRSLDR
ncbi:hypothetical protein SAMN04489832_0655 [Micromonospora cremea]|uniref:Uncharacterized protein n=1 Tax=Micromonospora cremea TaxID=709881 RepID=A0A1N5U8K4_9ACTN|nr:hypothetical protein SAMN04489832_0655 [Micromonospora cremea]